MFYSGGMKLCNVSHITGDVQLEDNVFGTAGLIVELRRSATCFARVISRLVESFYN